MSGIHPPVPTEMPQPGVRNTLARIFPHLSAWGGPTLFMGVVMTTCFGVFVSMPALDGPNVIGFLTYFIIAAAAYGVAVARLSRDRPPFMLIWSFAVVFRILLLFTQPSLSTDVFRYLWDGHLLNQGINPYAAPVNSPLLDPYHIPFRSRVDHAYMASPYLPVAQWAFAAVYRILPQSLAAFQVVAVAFDLLAALFLMKILQHLRFPPRYLLIYLWNPLVVVEFAQGAHIDALMICLVMASFWLLISNRRSLSTFALAGATLTKGLPLLLMPVMLRRLGLRRLLLFGALVGTALGLFAQGAGWGLSGPLDGTGLFGAIRIYLDKWNFNSGLYHWLEVWLTGYQTPGAVPVSSVRDETIRLARLISSAALALSSVVILAVSWVRDDPARGTSLQRNRALLRLSAAAVGVYLLTTHTVHPWYLTLIVPFLPFLLPAKEERSNLKPLMWAWIYLSLAVPLSYLTYINPQNLQEYILVRQVEYIPFFLLLGWALVRLTTPTLRRWALT